MSGSSSAGTGVGGGVGVYTGGAGGGHGVLGSPVVPLTSRLSGVAGGNSKYGAGIAVEVDAGAEEREECRGWGGQRSKRRESAHAEVHRGEAAQQPRRAAEQQPPLRAAEQSPLGSAEADEGQRRRRPYPAAAMPAEVQMLLKDVSS